LFIDVPTGVVHATTGEDARRWNQAPASTSAGWLPDGTAVIAYGEWGCGNSGTAGVYRASPCCRSPVLFHRASSARPPAIFAWRLGSPPPSGACDLPVEVGATPPGWDPQPRPGAAEGHPNGSAIAHWVGPNPTGDVITVVGKDGGGLVAPVTSSSTTEPVEVFTSMGNPAFVVPIHDAFAAQVDPPNAPEGCSPLFLIGDSVSAATLRSVAEALRSRNEPPRADIAVTGAAVRGARITIRASGPTWPSGPIELQLANPDGFGSLSAGVATHALDGSLTATFVVPSAISYDGLCRSTGSCDRLTTAVGPMRVRFRPNGSPRLVGEGTFAVVPAKRSVAYPVELSWDCNRPRVEFDGKTWVSTTPGDFGDDVPYRIGGTITIRSATRATFRSPYGGDVTLRTSPTADDC
jgi:hypothetical protein